MPKGVYKRKRTAADIEEKTEAVETSLVTLHIESLDDLLKLHRLMSVTNEDQYEDFDIVDSTVFVKFSYVPERDERLLTVCGLTYDG